MGNRVFISFVIFLLFYQPLLSLASHEGDPFPHFSKEGCNVCHTAHGSKALVKDPINLCKGCHPTSHEKDHKVGIKAILNKANLPLDSDGRITCAYTCHNMHPSKGSPYEQKLLRTDPDSLCLSCHEK